MQNKISIKKMKFQKWMKCCKKHSWQNISFYWNEIRLQYFFLLIDNADNCDFITTNSNKIKLVNSLNTFTDKYLINFDVKTTNLLSLYSGSRYKVD